VIRTRAPTRRTEPSITPCTPSSRPISRSGFLASLYCITEVRDITFSDPIFDRSVISSSVMPSAKYSCSGSPERFASGNTASE